MLRVPPPSTAGNAKLDTGCSITHNSVWGKKFLAHLCPSFMFHGSGDAMYEKFKQIVYEEI